MPGDSNWNKPVVSPREKSLKVSSSSNGISSSWRVMCLDFLMFSRHVLMMESVRSPRKSILIKPMGSTKCPSYCVVIRLSPSVGMMGMWSVSGSRLMRIPQAWMPVCRTEPSSVSANWMVLAISGFCECFSFSRSGFSSYAFFKVIFGVSGTILARRLASESSSFSTRATSLIAILAAMLPKVTMCATLSVPYFCATHSNTCSRPASSKSTSISGNEIRSGFKKRSNSRSYFTGSIFVIPRQ